MFTIWPLLTCYNISTYNKKYWSMTKPVEWYMHGNKFTWIRCTKLPKIRVLFKRIKVKLSFLSQPLTLWGGLRNIGLFNFFKYGTGLERILQYSLLIFAKNIQEPPRRVVDFCFAATSASFYIKDRANRDFLNIVE